MEHRQAIWLVVVSLGKRDGGDCMSPGARVFRNVVALRFALFIVSITTVSFLLAARLRAGSTANQQPPPGKGVKVSGRVFGIVLGKKEERPVQKAAAGAAVHLRDLPPGWDAKPAADPVTLKFIKGRLVPEFACLQVGQQLVVRASKGEIFDLSAFSQARGNYGRIAPANPMVFTDRFPEPDDFVLLTCAIHPGARAHLQVVPTPGFILCDSEGKFNLPRRLPRGRHVLKAFLPGMGWGEETITLQGDEGRVIVEIALAPQSKEEPAPLPPQGPKKVTAAEKTAFLKLFEKLPTEHEGIYTAEAIDKAQPHTRIFLALTEKDIEQYAKSLGIKNYCLYPFAALSAGLLERKRPREYVVKHFGEIAHAELKLGWAVGVFNKNAASPEIVKFLRAALKSKEQAQELRIMLGADFEEFNKRLRKAAKQNEVDLNWIAGTWRSYQLDYGHFGEWAGTKQIELVARSPKKIDLWLIKADGKRERAGDSQPSIMDEKKLFFGPIGSGLLFHYQRKGEKLVLDLGTFSVRIHAELEKVPPIFKKAVKPRAAFGYGGFSCTDTAYAFSPDNRLFAVGGYTNLWLRDANSGKEILYLSEEVAAREVHVASLAFSPNGKMLAIGGYYDGAVRLWDVSKRKWAASFKGHRSTVWAVAFSPDGKTLASASGDGNLHLWDIATGKERAKHKANGNWVMAVAYSADGKTLASGGEDSEVVLWDAAAGKPRQRLAGHDNAVDRLVFSADGKLLASSSRDGTSRIWDVASGKGVGVLPAVGTFSPDGRFWIAYTYGRGNLVIWDIQTGVQRVRIKRPEHLFDPVSMVVSPDGKTLAVRSDSERIYLWDLDRLLPAEPKKKPPSKRK